MKEIKYAGNLEEDVKNLKLEPWTKEKFKKYFLANYCFDNLMIFGMTFLIFFLKLIFLNAVDMNKLDFYIFESIICCCSSLIVSIPVSYIQTKIDKKNHELKTITSLFNMNRLSNKLKNNEELNIKVNVNNMKKAIIKEKKEAIKSDLKYNDEDKKKIVKYFYLLDNNDQIQVLKQIKTSIKNQDSQLYLLEEEDKKNIKMPEKIMKLEFK